MIQMQLTDAGLAAITGNQHITFLRFVTGSGNAGTDHIVSVEQDVPISYSQTYIKGQSYLINGVQTTVNYNAVELIGTLSSAQASNTYTWTELALIARIEAGQEFTFAYGISVNNAYHVNPSEPVTFVIPFSVIFTATPNVTVQTTETGVSWSAFMEHANLNVITGAHGLEVKNGRIYVNNIELDIASQTALVTDINTLRAEMQLADGELNDSLESIESSLTADIQSVNVTLSESIDNKTSALLLDLNSRTKNILGVDIIVDALPLNPIDYLGQVALLTTDDKWYRSEYRDVIEPGDWIKAVGGVWMKVTSDTEDAMLVVADDAELGNMEIHVTDAQAYFTIWSPLRGINIRLEDLESTTTNYLTYKELDDTEYNDEWVDRLKGSGTAFDPYLIFTPKDFEQIRNGGENLYKFYKIMNNLDFSKAIGIVVNIIDGEIQYETVDETAPMYNNGKGFIPFPTWNNYMNLDGGNHTIKNIIISDTENNDNCGIFRAMGFSSVENLIIKDTYIGYTRNHNVNIGSLAGRFENQCQIYNVVSHAYIMTNTGDYYTNAGGIVGCVKNKNRFENCAFHGTIKGQKDQWNNFGGIAGYDDIGDNSFSEKSTFTACYNTSDLTGADVCGICRRSLKLYNCYNSGRIVSTDNTSRSNSLTSLGSSSSLSMTNCYSLEGCASTIQGTVLTDSQLKSPSAVDKLNADLGTPSWVSSEGGYPMLDFEMLNEANLKPSIPIAAVDPASKLVINSGYTIGRLLHLPSEASITELRRDVDSKSSVSNLSITLASDGWSDSLQTFSNLSNVTAESVLVLIPKSADTFTNGISITAQAEGSMTFGCSSTPSGDIPVDVIVIN